MKKTSSSDKLVSIVTPCFNGERFIRRLLDSVLNQNYKKIEFIVIDDGSEDNSLEILHGYEEKFRKRGIKYIVLSKNNGGAASAINLGLRQYSGDYITFIDADDFLNENSISDRVEFLENNKQFDAVYSKTYVVNEDDICNVVETLEEIETPNRTNLFLDMLLERNYIWTPAYMVRSSHFRAIHATNHIEEFKVGQNIQLYLPLWHKGVVGYINSATVTIVAHEDSHSRIKRNEEGDIHRQKQIQCAFVETVKRMDIEESEKQEYLELLKRKYRHINERVFIDIQDGRDELMRLYARDQERFRKSHFSDARTANQNQLATRMTFSAHSLEKSLSNDNFEIGHGFMVIGLLRGFLEAYQDQGYDRSHKAYINTISVMKVFYERHKGTKYQEEIDDIIGERLLRLVVGSTSNVGGAFVISGSDKINNHKKNFKELAEERFAVRTYADKPVDKKDIEDVISIAMKTPTVCNRQPVRVRVMYDKDIIAKVLEVQGGIAYYDTPPVLILVTADDNSYVGVNERNQGYIDGGLFAMSILYAFEYKNLAACPLHAMFETERDFKIRGMLGIPDNEKLITFISAGHFDKKSGVCKSFRYDPEYILTEVNELHDFRVEIVVPEVDDHHQSAVEKTTADKIREKVRIRTRIKQFRSDVRIRTRLRGSLNRVNRLFDILEYSKADGAILTLTGYFNYGNVIQRYALQEFLRNNGYNFVSYVDPYSAPRDMYRMSRKKLLKTPLRAAKRIAKAQKPYWYTPPFREIYPEAYRVENIISFVNRNIWIKPFDPRDSYKRYIVGSDQVWRDWWGDKSILGYYFLDFLKGRKAKRISYAASFGNDDIRDVMSEEDVKYVAPYISSFDSVSVREKSATTILESVWGVQGSETVIDPTLLLDAQQYSDLIESTSVKDQSIQPIFSYVLGETPELLNFIDRIQESRKQPVTRIRAHGGSENDILPPVEYWLKGYRDAELVVTNSFHGMMFSVINNTDFIIIGRKSGGLSRIKDFLDQFGIADRFVPEEGLEEFDVDSIKPIDWDFVNQKLDKLKKTSGQWLLNSLQDK